MSTEQKQQLARIVAPVLFAVASPALFVLECTLGLLRGWRQFDASGKTVVITGASGGIGAALAVAYARRGAVLVLVARNTARLAAVQAECEAVGARKVTCLTVDVTRHADYAKALISANLGTIDLLVLNAGVSMGAYAADFADAEPFTTLAHINYLAVVNGILASLSLLRSNIANDKFRRPKIAVVSSVLGLAAAPTRSGYCASKFALKGFLDAFRLENPDIDCTMIYPGAVKTNINETRIGNVGNLDWEAKDVMSAEDAARLIVDAVNRGARDEIFTLKYNFFYYLGNLFPLVRDLLIVQNFQKSTTLNKKHN
ncbi:hypothetical protein HK100_003571 [Physocladia obscura]|uniref:Uncharacterized protein n=1 Tax=Physocladia obscura TaxID=109957 RepID=A0AAD5SZW9_9FUNG|nr:hypothetical protein HK100_003571 [Physocladia obscura]